MRVHREKGQNRVTLTLPTMSLLEQPQILGGTDSAPYQLCMLPLLYHVENLADDVT